MPTYRFPLDLGSNSEENANLPWVEFRAVKYDHVNLILDAKTGKQADFSGLFNEDQSPNYALATQILKTRAEDNAKAVVKTVSDPSGAISSTIEESHAANQIKTRGERQSISSGYSFCFPLPQQFGTSYSSQWEMKDTKFIDIALRGFSNALNRFDGNGKASAMEVFGGVTDLAQMGTDIATVALFGQFSQIFGARTLNPKKQAIYNGIDPRSFGFDYTFVAHSAKEAETIEKMLSDLVYCTLPSEAEDKLFFEFPYEWEIKFHNVRGYPKLSSCVCNSISVNPGTSNAQLLDSGHPIQMNLTMSFMETSLRTKQSPGI